MIAAKYRCVYTHYRKTVVPVLTLTFLLLIGLLNTCFITSYEAQGTTSDNYNLDAVLDLTNETYTSVNAVCVGDSDNDGKNEIIANYDWYAHDSETNIPATVILEKSGGTYEVEDKISNFSMLLHPGLMCQGIFHIVVEDADNDGENEILMPGKLYEDVGIYLFKYDGHGYNVLWNALSSNYEDGEIYDINRDGLNELIVPGLGVLQWNGTDFTQIASLKSADGVRVGDMDGDGEKEVVLGVGSLGIEVYKWEDGELVLKGSASDSGYISAGFGLADSDDDGKEEAFRVEYHNSMVVYGYNGQEYVKEWEGTTPTNDNPVTAWAGDADGDSVGELFIGNGNNANGISFLQYEYDNGDYPTTWSYTFDMYCDSIAAGDSDNDGYIELIGGTGSHGRLYVFSRAPDLTPCLTTKVEAEPDFITEQEETTITIYVKCGKENITGANILLNSSIGGSFSPIYYKGNGEYQTTFTPPPFEKKMYIRIRVSVSKSGYLDDEAYTSIYYMTGDTDSDGYPNDVDDFPFDPAASLDSDGDGYPDEWNYQKDEYDSTTGLSLDAFPYDPSQWSDSDDDGYGDNQTGSNPDALPYDSTQWSDIDKDGYGDNPEGNNPDAFPYDPTQWNDRDEDGYGDNPEGNNPDEFPDDPDEWKDSDSDGIGDNADSDDDNDGMPDDWEEENELDPNDPKDAKEDPDDDGYSNLDEYKEDTDPLDSTSRPGLPILYWILMLLLVVIIIILLGLLMRKKRSQEQGENNLRQESQNYGYQPNNPSQQYYYSESQPPMDNQVEIVQPQEARIPQKESPLFSSIVGVLPNRCRTCGNLLDYIPHEGKSYCYYCGKYD
jgi:hypothetical protein